VAGTAVRGGSKTAKEVNCEQMILQLAKVRRKQQFDRAFG